MHVPHLSDGIEVGCERLLAFAPDHIAQINVHFGVVPREEMKKFGSMEGKRDALRALGGILSDLPERGKRVVIETLPSPSDMADAFFYSGVLPSDFKLALSNNHAGMTIDTAHTGINQYRCRHMVKTGELLEGFSKTDKKEIEALAKDPITPYLDAVGKVRHVHFSDYLTPRGVLPQDGIVFGKGLRTPHEMWEQLRAIRGATRQAFLGATLEIKEDDYIYSPELRGVLEWIRQMEGE
jgi:hypothetical protein